MSERYELTVAPLVKASYAFEGDALVYRQGVRTIAVPLASVRGFAVRARPGSFGLPNSQLIVALEQRTRRFVFDPASPACQALLDALRARLPAADLTALPWPEAAQRLGVAARPWYEFIFQPRVMVGMVLLGANAFATSTLASTRDKDERLGQAIVFGVVGLVGLYLIITGILKSRRAR